MGLIRLGVCVSGVYGAFLLWAIAQERLSKPFAAASQPHHTGSSHEPGDPFPSPLFLNYVQSLASALSALVYLIIGGLKDGRLKEQGILKVLGLSALQKQFQEAHSPGNGHSQDSNGTGKVIILNGTETSHFSKSLKGIPKSPITKKRSLLTLLLQVSVFQTMAGPIGFLALRHISFPTMVLGKSCKLIPVLILNVILYRRRFSPHKYVVVALVTVGISMFMLFGASSKKKGGSDSIWGLSLLIVNLLIDGLTNSTQDQIFTLYPEYTGQQLMLGMSLITQLLLAPALILPLPSHPISALPFALTGAEHRTHLTFSSPAILTSIRFLYSHPSAVAPVAAYALLGGLGQLFIFETIKSFGSLALTMITVTRKLFTMLLSVVVFKHRLTVGQWAGVAVVFSGIGVEAAMKGMGGKHTSRS